MQDDKVAVHDVRTVGDASVPLQPRINAAPLSFFGRPRILFPSSVILLAISFVSLYQFAQADQLTLGPGKMSAWSNPRGYTEGQLLLLLVYLVASPAGVVALLMGLTNSLKVQTGHMAPTLACVILGSMGSAMALGFNAFEGSQMLGCLYVFCYDATPKQNDTSAFIAQQGTLVFFLGWTICMSCILAYMTNRAVPQVADVKTAQRYLVLRRRIATVSLIVAVPCMCIVCGILPGTWEKMTREGIGKLTKAEMGVGKSEIAPCDGSSTKACGTALLTTIDVHLGGVIVHLWPDTLMFYSMLEVFVIGGFLSCEFPIFAKLASRRVCKAKLGSIAVALLLTMFYVLNSIYWAHDHLYHEVVPGAGADGKFNKSSMELLARTLGLNAVATMGLLLLPSSKNSLVLQVAGFSWESSLWLHIVLGSLFMILALGHVLSFFVRFCQLGYPADILPFNGWLWYPTNKPTMPNDNWTIAMMSSVFWPSVVIFGMLPWWRRVNWEVFKITHHWFLVLIPAVIIHANSAWYFVFPGATIWILDRMLRFFNAVERVEVVAATAHTVESWSDARDNEPSVCLAEKITELRLRWRGRSREHSPGMYCFINCPQLSAVEWHPFSLSSSPLDSIASFHIKSMDSPSNKGTFTGRLHEHVEQLGSPSNLVLNIDGPYGPALSFNATSVLLIAGGIGVTPMHNTMRFLLGQMPTGLRRVHLLWAARSPKMFDVFATTLHPDSLLRSDAASVASSSQSSCEPQVTLYCSTIAAEGRCDLGRVLAGRPNFERVLREQLADGDCMVRICGPDPMVKACQSAVDCLPEDLRVHADFEVWSFVL